MAALHYDEPTQVRASADFTHSPATCLVLTLRRLEPGSREDFEWAGEVENLNAIEEVDADVPRVHHRLL